MRLWLDVSRAQFMVTRNPEPKIGDRKTRVQKVDSDSGLPMWTTELMALTDKGASVLQVTTISETVPTVSVGENVVPESLEALPWTNKDRDGETRHGVAFRAAGLKVLTSAAK